MTDCCQSQHIFSYAVTEDWEPHSPANMALLEL